VHYGAAILFIYAAYRLGVANERFFPGDRPFTTMSEGEGVYMFALVLLVLLNVALAASASESSP
jgi:hypothetical protein